MIEISKALTPALQKIHETALTVSSDFKKCEERIIEVLIEVESSGLHLRLGCSSLFNYTQEYMTLSEAVSLNAIAVARKAREVPELRKEVQTIGISKARKMVSVLTKENQKEWIERAKSGSTRALEKAVAKENPRAATPEKATYVSEKRLDLRLGVSEELMLKIRRAQDQVSRSKGKPASLEETFEAAIAFYLQHKDPLEKAKRVIAKKGTASLNKLFTGTVPHGETTDPQAHSRRPIPAAIAHQIRMRDQNQCQAKNPGGGICGEK